MPYITQEVEVWVDLDEFDTDDLIEELESRDTRAVGDSKLLIQKMYEHQQMGKDIQLLLNQLYDTVLKRIM